jgi:hypothetical protein
MSKANVAEMSLHFNLLEQIFPNKDFKKVLSLCKGLPLSPLVLNPEFDYLNTNTWMAQDQENLDNFLALQDIIIDTHTRGDITETLELFYLVKTNAYTQLMY